VIVVNRPIEGGDFGSAGSATRVLKDQLRMAGVPLDALRRAMIASYEAEMNVVIHARRGSLWARTDGLRLDLEVIDEGPGIPDLELALREGWSTATDEARRMGFGAGMGLPNIRRNSDRFEIDSQVGRGTRVRSTILLADRAGAAPARCDGDAAAPAPGLRADRCRACHACLSACPTAAIRVRDGGPRLLADRCIGSTECALACRDHVFGLAAADPIPDTSAGDVALVLPAGFLAGFAAAPAMVLSALGALGFAEISITEDWERALRFEALDRACGGAGPLVAPACPAVVALVEARFPGLLGRMAPFATPLAAAAAGFPLLRMAVVPACPAQRESVLAESRAGRVALIAPTDLVVAMQPLLADRSVALPGAADQGAAPRTTAAAATDDPPGVLRVTGMRHVVRALELAEAGALPDVLLLEPYACDAGCLGSPYLGIDAFVAAHRLAAPGMVDGGRAAAVEQRRPPVSRAGAPTCAAFAEDLVVGRAGASDCPHRTRPLGGAAARPRGGAAARGRLTP
jgi:anti-sigma regulatory factor (Ser/Thr protein kinase)/Pyruvate/2-oxoacid:ferredoxin oxidoreductase delta subunit